MTALQKLIEIMNHMIENGDNDLLPLRIYAVNLLEKEKEQIIEAFYQGRNLYNDFDDDPEIYYDDTYKQ